MVSGGFGLEIAILKNILILVLVFLPLKILLIISYSTILCSSLIISIDL